MAGTKTVYHQKQVFSSAVILTARWGRQHSALLFKYLYEINVFWKRVFVYAVLYTKMTFMAL